jgi:RimJ/RimL family protein N-acetyltransferase
MAEAFVTRIVPEGWGQGRWAFAVEAVDDTGTARFAGTVELRDEGNRRAEIAYGSHPWARGRGLVHRALELLLEWGFGTQGLRVVSWWANRGNWASRRTAWRLGFTCDGWVERWLPQRGDLVDGWVGVLHVDDPRAPRGPWLEATRLAGQQVVLRGLRESDLPRVVEARPFDAWHAEAWLVGCGEEAAAGSGVTWAVADPRDDRLLGCVGVSGIVPGRGAEIGWWAHPDARGPDVTTEACRLAVRQCLTPYDEGGLGLPRVHVGAGEGDTASLRVIEATGFTPVGRERRSLVLGDGTLTDRLTFDLLAAEVRPGG